MILIYNRGSAWAEPIEIPSKRRREQMLVNQKKSVKGFKAGLLSESVNYCCYNNLLIKLKGFFDLSIFNNYSYLNNTNTGFYAIIGIIFSM